MEDRAEPGGNAGAHQSFFFIQGSQEEAAHLAELRQRHGDDAVDWMLRERELVRDLAVPALGPGRLRDRRAWRLGPASAAVGLVP